MNDGMLCFIVFELCVVGCMFGVIWFCVLGVEYGVYYMFDGLLFEVVVFMMLVKWMCISLFFGECIYLLL